MFGAIRNNTFSAHSFYHGLQTRLLHRINRGLQTQVSYGFSKSIDDSSSFFGDNESANPGLLPLNGRPKFNRSRSSYDVRHSVAASGIWELPWREAPGWRRISGGWQLAAIVTYASGLPTSPWLDYDAAKTQSSETGPALGQRPDLAPGASNNPVTGDPRGWVDRNAFRRPATGFLGNLGRNTIIGSDLAAVDFSLAKHMRFAKLGEAASLDLRAEFFNLFNRTNFNLPDPTSMVIFDEASTRGDFGRITSAAKSREIQFGLKLRF